MICLTCGTSNRDGAKFCNRCGHPLHIEHSNNNGEDLLRQLDLCFVMDATGSMKDYIETTCKELKTFAQRLSAHNSLRQKKMVK